MAITCGMLGEAVRCERLPVNCIEAATPLHARRSVGRIRNRTSPSESPISHNGHFVDGACHIDLCAVVVPFQVRRRDLGVLVVDFAQDVFVAHPLRVVVEQARISSITYAGWSAFAQFKNDMCSDRTRAGMKAALALLRWSAALRQRRCR